MALCTATSQTTAGAASLFQQAPETMHNRFVAGMGSITKLYATLKLCLA